jgi:glycosyltransferase involved in cell wall biosynthesis
MTLNHEEFIIECLDSISRQLTTFDFEVCLSDDNSSDNTYELALEYLKKSSLNYSINQNKQQLGLLRNYQKTLGMCQGKYVFDLAGDDFINDTYAIQTMVDIFKKNPKIGFIECGYDHYYQKNKKTVSYVNRERIRGSKEAYTNSILSAKHTGVGFCYKKDSFLKFVDINEYVKLNFAVEDYPITIDLLMNCKFKTIDNSLVTYRIHKNSLSHNKELDRVIRQTNSINEIINHYTNKYKLPNKFKKQVYQQTQSTLLYYSGYLGNILLGKKAFQNIQSKNLKNYLDYASSQNSLFRFISSFLRKI